MAPVAADRRLHDPDEELSAARAGDPRGQSREHGTPRRIIVAPARTFMRASPLWRRRSCASSSRNTYVSAAAILALAAPAGAAAAPPRRTTGASTPPARRSDSRIDAVGFPRTEGRFRRFEGRISIDFDHPSRSSVVFHVQSQSVDVGSTSFSDYLRSVAFLNSARHPSIDFVSTSVERINDHAVRVSGQPDAARRDQADRRRRRGRARGARAAASASSSTPRRRSTGSHSA